MSGVVFLALLPFAALGASFHWTGNGPDNLWTTATNWQPLGLPDASDDVTVTSGSVLIGTAAGGLARHLRISGNTTTVEVRGTFLSVGDGGLQLGGGVLIVDSGAQTVTVKGSAAIGGRGMEIHSGSLEGNFTIHAGAEMMWVNESMRYTHHGSIYNRGRMGAVKGSLLTVGHVWNEVGGRMDFPHGSSVTMTGLVNDALADFAAETVYITGSAVNSGILQISQGSFRVGNLTNTRTISLTNVNSFSASHETRNTGSITARGGASTFSHLISTAGSTLSFREGSLHVYDAEIDTTVSLVSQSTTISRVEPTSTGRYTVTGGYLSGIGLRHVHVEGECTLSGSLSDVTVGGAAALRVSTHLEIADVSAPGATFQNLGSLTFKGAVNVKNVSVGWVGEHVPSSPGTPLVTTYVSFLNASGTLTELSAHYTGQCFTTFKGSEMHVEHYRVKSGEVHIIEGHPGMGDLEVTSPGKLVVGSATIQVERRLHFAGIISLNGHLILPTGSLFTMQGDAHVAPTAGGKGRIEMASQLEVTTSNKVTLHQCNLTGRGTVHILSGRLDMELLTADLSVLHLATSTSAVTGESLTLEYQQLTGPTQGAQLELITDSAAHRCRSPCSAMIQTFWQTFVASVLSS